MKHQQDGQFDEAKHIYQEILESEIMEEIGVSSGRSGTDGGSGEVTQTSTIARLKYLIYKNLASISKEQGDYSAAVDAYIEVHNGKSKGDWRVKGGKNRGERGWEGKGGRGDERKKGKRERVCTCVCEIHERERVCVCVCVCVCV